MNAGAPVPATQPSLVISADGTASFFTAFADEQGFGLSFFLGKQCRGEICADSEYWFFETDGKCAPKMVGHFRKVERTAGRYGTCFDLEGSPLWGWPSTPAGRRRCDADWSAQNISGTRKAMALDPVGTCAKESILPVELTITQGGELSKAQLIVTGTGIPFLDGVSFAGTVERQSFSAEIDEVSSAACAARRKVTIRLDFEEPSNIGLPGGFGLVDIDAAACPGDTNGAGACHASLHLIRSN